MFFLVTPNTTVNAQHIDVVEWETSYDPLTRENVLVAYVSFESGKKAKLVGNDARVLREKYDAMRRGEIKVNTEELINVN